MSRLQATARYFLALTLVFAAFSALGETEMVPMRDGTKLATDVLLPKGDGPFPVVLVRTVYGRVHARNLAGLFNAKGMAFIIQDTRGRGDSEGKDWGFRDDGWGKLQDGADTVAWIHKQSWCNGKVGTFGMSALGITQVLMAGATQDIAAQGIWVAPSTFYGQLSYIGGVFRKSLCEWWLKGQKSEWVVDLWKSHPTYDSFWQGFNVEPRAGQITAPAIHVGGWWDIFQQGTINNFVTRQHNGGPGAKGNQILVIGPWLHGPVPKPGDVVLPDNYKFDFTNLTVKFLDHWLTGAKNGIMDEPPVHYYTMGDFSDKSAPGNEWRTAPDWPPFPTHATSYYLTLDKSLALDAPKVRHTITYLYDPANPCPTMGGANLFMDKIPTGPVDQRKLKNRQDVIKFATPPLTEPVEVTGHVKAVLYVGTNAPDTDFTAKLVDIYPDGRELEMLDGIQRCKFRKSFSEPEMMSADDIAKLDVDLWSISLIFNKGHRIGVQISSSNYPRFEKNPNTGQDFPDEKNLRVAKNTIFVGGDSPSAIILPVRPAEK